MSWMVRRKRPPTELVVPLLRLRGPPVDALSREPPPVDDEDHEERDGDDEIRPGAPELDRDQSRNGEEQDHLRDSAPLRRALLEVAEEDVSDREDRRGNGDFEPGIHGQT